MIGTDTTGDVTVDGDVVMVDIVETETVDVDEIGLITGAEAVAGAGAVEGTTDCVVDGISIDDDVLVVAVTEVVVRVAGNANRYGDCGCVEIGSNDKPERVWIGDDIVHGFQK